MGLRIVIACALTGICSVLSGNPAGAAEVYLGITRTDATRISASLIRVLSESSISGRSTEIRAVLEGDLERSEVFRMEDPPSMPQVFGIRYPEASLIKEIGTHGIDAVIWVSLKEQGEDWVLEGRVYDGGSSEMVMGKRYIGDPKLLRKMVHRLSDEIVFRYTGEPGIAQTQIAYVSKLTGSKEIYMMDYDGHNPRRITSDRSLALSPEWSPDMKWITYTSYRDGNPDIFTLELQTGRRWKMVGFPALNISPSWSPLGDRLVFASTKGGSLQLYTMDRDGTNLVQLTRGIADNLSPTSSPTGNEIAFISNRGGNPQVYLVKKDGTNLRRLTYNGSYNTSPAWSPNGDWIAYTCQVEGRMRVCLITPDGKEYSQLTDGLGGQEDPSWSPDGRHLVYRSTQKNQGGDLYRISIGSKRVERLTFNGAMNSNPVWSPFSDK